MSRSRGRLATGWRLRRRIFRAASSSGVWRTLAAKGAADARASERNPNSDSADALRSDVLIGAPRANTSGEVLERGAVYSCPWAGGAAACRQVLFDSSGTPVRHHARRLPLSKLRTGKTLFFGGLKFGRPFSFKCVGNVSNAWNGPFPPHQCRLHDSTA